MPANLLRAHFTKRHITMQDERITDTWLRNRGYTVAAAARKIGRNVGHVYRVVKGKRESIAVLNALRSLPQRPFAPREAITTR